MARIPHVDQFPPPPPDDSHPRIAERRDKVETERINTAMAEGLSPASRPLPKSIRDKLGIQE